jgi:hypothetical protein
VSAQHFDVEIFPGAHPAMRAKCCTTDESAEDSRRRLIRRPSTA